HFDLNNVSPYKVGRKALAVSLSDIAAMAGIPKYCLVSLGVSPRMPLNVLDEFYSGLLELASQFDVELVGGDTNCSEKLICDVCVLGEVEKKFITRRDGAKAGDSIFVTGFLGGSIKGKQYDFAPRIKEARILVENFKVNSMIDISDGLSADLHHITDASRVGAVIYDNCIPVSQDALSRKEALSGGEDFELMFTLPDDVPEHVLSKKLNVPVKKIGKTMPKREGVRIAKSSGMKKEFKQAGYRHF
ncbi:MAG: thiamine-phosphate kinase, partial [Candidatus Omnitrophota bacterium]|nr:thiamine-phosphate kinase [Candidatus Omnitrophota bacterium]